MTTLEINHLSKSFGRVKALNDLSLGVHSGEFLILLGPTGAGKTTTLRCVAGLEKPDSGTVSMGGARIDGLSPAERDVSFVFQSYALYPRKTVYENMAFPLRAREMPADVMRSRIQDVAAKLRITELLQRRPAQLSGGQQQRVALGRAMVREPRMFLMDEPLTNLDFKLRVEMRAELKRLQKELGATFFYVTNDQVEAMSMADRIAILSQGVLQQIDSPETIYTRPANLFVAGFVGSPRMNFLDCVFDPATRALVADDQTWQMPLSPAQINMLERSANGGGYVLGLRAENVEPVWESAPGVIPGQVYVVEPLGDRTLVDIKIGASMIKAKVPPTFAAQTGESLGVRFDHERFSLFNKSTGEVVL